MEMPNFHWHYIFDGFLYVWSQIRNFLIVPLLRVAVFICLVMTIMVLAEKLVLGVVSLLIRVLNLVPEKRYKWEAIKHDEEIGSSVFPMVLVQIPMCNEREVYKLSIGAACQLEWPHDRFVIQVLDDSTDPEVKDLVSQECEKWKKNKGLNIKYEIRNNRKGYKAGALKEGMKHDYVQDCEYIAMFDADFQPESDFLLKTIPFLTHNPEIALVQTRWIFVNANECLMTRFQEMSLDYHFKIEQESGSSMYAFFGFNGTAGVWRISAIEDAGGWQDRTTVEDMDLAVRASLQGWKFLYLGDVKVKSELPSTFKAFRYQQHRWSCGPVKLFKKMVPDIIRNKRVSLIQKFHLVYDFFFVGKIISHMSTFSFYCAVIPLSTLFAEVHIPFWAVVYAPTLITLCKSVGTPRSMYLIVFWVLYENVMSLHRLKGAIVGFLEMGRVDEWVVTEKLGDVNKLKTDNINGIKDALLEIKTPELTSITKSKGKDSIWQRLYYSELIVGVLLLYCGYYDLEYSKKGYYIFIFIQSISFFVVGFGYIGTHPPGS